MFNDGCSLIIKKECAGLTKMRASVGGNAHFSSVLQHGGKMAGSVEAYFCLDFFVTFLSRKK
jgi:hypothetical protein